MTILVTGTLAIDHIAEVSDGFQDGDLNGKLHQPDTHWGGCGMNLTYALSKAGHAALPWIYYGDNCPEAYQAHLQDQRLDQQAMYRQAGARCAEAYIFSRKDGSQLTGFYPGSTQFETPKPKILNTIAQCSHWIAGPEDDATLLARLKHIERATQLYWMPGQYAEVTRNNVLQPMLERRPHLLVNQSEWTTLQNNVGEHKLNATTGSVFITRGASGVRFRLDNQTQWQERATQATTAVDPTGCGDAFCGTLVGELVAGIDPLDAIDKAQSQAARCLGLYGAQRY